MSFIVLFRFKVITVDISILFVCYLLSDIWTNFWKWVLVDLQDWPEPLPTLIHCMDELLRNIVFRYSCVCSIYEQAIKLSYEDYNEFKNIAHMYWVSWLDAVHCTGLEFLRKLKSNVISICQVANVSKWCESMSTMDWTIGGSDTKGVENTRR